MGTSGISPAVQTARAEVNAVRENMDGRVKSAGRLKTAIEHLDLNIEKGFFNEKNSELIKNLVKNTEVLTKAIGTLEQAGVDAGTCKLTRTVPGRLFGTRQVQQTVGMAQANGEVRNVVEDPVVVASLRTLGILAKPKEPFFKMPEAPSGKTVAKAAGFTAGAATIGAGIYFRNEISAAIQIKNEIGAAIQIKTFAWDNKIALGVGAGALVAIGAGVAIYKHQKNKQAAAAAAAQAAAQQMPVADDQKKV